VTVEAGLGDDDAVVALHGVDTRRVMRSGRKAVVVGLAAVVAAVAFFFLAARLAGSGEVQDNLTEDVFDVGSADRLADAIDRDGAPLIFDDPLGRGRAIFVQHVGDDQQEGWLAFDAVVDGCPLEWDGAEEVFEDTCTGEVYDRQGGGLRQYPASVDEDDRVVVDLKRRTG